MGPTTQKQSNNRWNRHSGIPRSKKFRAGKNLASVSWDCQGVLMIDFLDKDRTKLEITFRRNWAFHEKKNFEEKTQKVVHRCSVFAGQNSRSQIVCFHAINSWFRGRITRTPFIFTSSGFVQLPNWNKVSKVLDFLSMKKWEKLWRPSLHSKV